MKKGLEITTTDSLGRRIEPSLEVGKFGGYTAGTILDANAVNTLVKAKIDDVIGGASEALDTLKELGDALPTKLSQLTNDSGFVTKKDVETAVNINEISVISNQPFPSTWPTDNSHTFQDLVDAIDADEDAIKGKVYMSTVHYSDMQNAIGLVDGELKVEIMDSTGSHKIAVFTITSANASPYYWQNTMWNGQLHDISNVAGEKWISFVPSTSIKTVATTGDYDDLTNKPTIPTVPTNVSDFNNDAGYLTSHQDISGKADASTTVTNVEYDSANSKITKTINGTTTDVVTVSTLKTAFALGAAAEKAVDTTVTSGSANLITSGAVYTMCGDIETLLAAI